MSTHTLWPCNPSRVQRALTGRFVTLEQFVCHGVSADATLWGRTVVPVTDWCVVCDWSSEGRTACLIQRRSELWCVCEWPLLLTAPLFLFCSVLASPAKGTANWTGSWTKLNQTDLTCVFWLKGRESWVSTPALLQIWRALRWNWN